VVSVLVVVLGKVIGVTVTDSGTGFSVVVLEKVIGVTVTDNGFAFSVVLELALAKIEIVLKITNNFKKNPH
jgi:hypothetical protein